MSLDPVAWGIGGGAVHQPETVRQALYDSTSGSEGVSAVNGLKVLASPTPGDKVRVRPGGALILNRYEGGDGQTYSARNISSTEVAISPTGSAAGRTDLMVLRILDPQYEGEPPADPTEFDYVRFEVIEGVPAKTETFAELNLDYPAIPLAKVTLPKSTATVTNAMIESLRFMAQPNREDVLRARVIAVEDEETLGIEAEEGEWFPNAGGGQRINIPWWATRIIIEASWIQVREPGGNSHGECWVEFGPKTVVGSREYPTPRFSWNTHSGNDVARSTWELAADRYVDPSIRGTEQLFVMKARVVGKTNLAARPQMDRMSGTKLRVTFLQIADPSTT